MFVALTFGGGSKKFNGAADRFKTQLEELEVFDTIISLNENNLKTNDDFWSLHEKFVENNSKGYGYWIWKPYLIMRQLECMKEEDILFYADAGCEVDLSKKEKFMNLKKYFLEKSCNNILAQKQYGYKEEQYCKMDTVVALDCNYDYIRKTPQYQANILALKNTKEVRDFVKKWYESCFLEDYHLLDDTESKLHNAHRFKEHRHDQALFSILYKKTFPSESDEFSVGECVFILRTRHGGSNLNSVYQNNIQNSDNYGLQPIQHDILEYFKNKNILIYDKCITSIACVKHINFHIKQIHEEYPNDKIIIFILCDYEFDIISYENQIIVRASAINTMLKSNEVILPYLWSPVYKPFEPLPKTEKPIVGFCGWRSKYRYEILKAIRADTRIQENYLIRYKFMGGHRLSDNLVDDFDNNMKESHFIICNRGTGNFSMRFFQTLASGRIPIVVNTAMQLPLHGIVDYSDVIVMENSVEKVIERLLWIWNNRDIVEIQQRCSEFYDKYLHYAAYPRYLHEELKLKELL